MLLICEKRSAKNRGFMAGIVELSTAPKSTVLASTTIPRFLFLPLPFAGEAAAEESYVRMQKSLEIPQGFRRYDKGQIL